MESVDLGLHQSGVPEDGLRTLVGDETVSTEGSQVVFRLLLLFLD